MVATLGGIVVISLAIPFDQMLGFGPLVLIMVPSAPNFRIAGVLQNELEATTRSIQEVSDLLDLISRPTQLAGGGPPGGIVLPPLMPAPPQPPQLFAWPPWLLEIPWLALRLWLHWNAS